MKLINKIIILQQAYCRSKYLLFDRTLRHFYFTLQPTTFSCDLIPHYPSVNIPLRREASSEYPLWWNIFGFRWYLRRIPHKQARASALLCLTEKLAFKSYPMEFNEIFGFREQNFRIELSLAEYSERNFIHFGFFARSTSKFSCIYYSAASLKCPR